jgi:hypothetical protein
MKAAARVPLLLLLASSSCGAPPAPAAVPAAPAAPKTVARPAPGPQRCPVSVDARDLLERHAKAFGAPDVITRALPLAVHGDVDVDGKTGAIDVVVAKDGFRSTTAIGGVVAGIGIDAGGSWQLPMGAGVVERLTGPGEDAEAHFEGWLLRRGYVKASPDRATCADEAAGARVDLVFAVEALASPTLSFDLASASLVAVSHRQPDGRIERVTYEAWSRADARGLRWPKKVTAHPATGSPVTVTYGAPRPASCGDECVRAPRSPLSLAWPNAGRVRIPLAFVRRSLLVRAGIGGRELVADLDSGASITVVDATTPAGQAFVPAFSVDGASATQKIRVGVGTLPAIALGALTASDVPTASVPIPALDAFGDKRPEVILGYSFFATAVIRVDYKRSEVVFGRTADGLFANLHIMRSSGTRRSQAPSKYSVRAWWSITTASQRDSRLLPASPAIAPGSGGSASCTSAPSTVIGPSDARFSRKKRADVSCVPAPKRPVTEIIGRSPGMPLAFSHFR